MATNMKESSKILIIDDSLRFVLFGIQSALGRCFSGKAIKQIFKDATDNQVSQKDYILFNSPDLQVFGVVEEYEPESNIITVKSKHFQQELFDQIVQNAAIEVYRLKDN